MPSAGAIGLAVSSTAPTWRDASIALWILSGVYLILVALASYGLGGYVAGLLREQFRTPADVAAGSPTIAATSTSPVDEVEMGDGLHGLLVWALATHPDGTIPSFGGIGEHATGRPFCWDSRTERLRGG